MSHFAVAVIIDAESGNDVEELLAPFNENLEIDFIEMNNEDVEYYKKVFSNESDNFVSFEDFLVENVGLSVVDGKYGYYGNNDAKWDWWTCGGRWSDCLLTNDGYYTDGGVMVNEVNWGIDNNVYNNALDEWEDFSVNGDGFYSAKYYTDRYKNAEEYAKVCATQWFRSVVTPDGKWHEVGEMGWWGISSESGDDTVKWVESYNEMFVKPFMDDRYYIYIVDCHI